MKKDVWEWVCCGEVALQPGVLHQALSIRAVLRPPRQRSLDEVNAVCWHGSREAIHLQGG